MKLEKAVAIARKNTIKPISDDLNTSKKRRKKSKKFFKKYGFHFEECWCLDHSIACYLLPRLVHLKKVMNTYPDGLTPEEWDEVLGKMIHGFKLIAEDKLFYNSENLAAAHEAIDLFAKHYFSLWD